MRIVTPIQSMMAAMGATALLSVGCGGGGSSPAPTPTQGKLSVTLVDGPTMDYKAITLNIQAVQIHPSATADESGWITVSSPNKSVDLLKLQGGLVEALASNQTIGVGTYQMMRLVLGTGNTLTLADDSVVPLTVPSGQQTGIKIPLNFTVQAGTTADVWIDFDGAHSIHVVGTGSGRYNLRPVVHGYMQTATGSVSGSLTGPGGTPLAGALVMAESVSPTGEVTLLRTATTTASGAYTLNLLPLGLAFHVVSQPVIGSATYTAQASPAITLTTAAATATANLSTTLALAVGSVTGTLSPMATVSQSDSVYLLQSLSTGLSGTATLMVASGNAVVGASSETYTLLLVPAGSYQVQGLRNTLNTDGTTVQTRSLPSSFFSVNNAAIATQNISF